MNKKTYQNTPSPKMQFILDTLKSAAVKTLETKRKLGQYAVIWKNGKVVTIGPDKPESN